MHSELITRIKQYVQLKKNDIPVIETLFRQKTLKKGELFLKEGKICRELGFIKKGLVCYYVTPDGNEVVHNFASENEFICNYDSFIKQMASQKNIMALEPVELLVISLEDLQQLFKTLSNGERFGRLLMEDVYTDAIKHILSFYTKSPEERYTQLLSTNKALQQRIPQYYIASYVGVKPQSLSRIRKRMLKS